MKPLVGKFSHKIAISLMNRYPQNAAFAKVEGMLRFYLDGNLAPDLQEWPDCIKQQAAEDEK
jgi:hypothetical protein